MVESVKLRGSDAPFTELLADLVPQKALHLFAADCKIPCLLQLATARQIERPSSDKQRALLFLSGVSLIGRRALLSGISSVELTCSATVFLRCPRPVERACSDPSVFALLHIQILKSFVLSCTRL